MKLENNIAWCDATTNAVTGCDKVSPGCKNCYAEAGTRARVLRAQGVETWGPKGKRAPVNFEPVFRRLNKLCVCDRCHESAHVDWIGREHVRNEIGLICGGKLRRIRLFLDSNSDWLDPKWPVETLARFLGAIRLAPNIDVQLLTKRIENFQERLGFVAETRNAGDTGMEYGFVSQWVRQWLEGSPPSHVWLGVSVENQKCADERIPQLLKTPAALRFLSVEPLLEDLDLSLHEKAIHFPLHVSKDGIAKYAPGHMPVNWVIVGGESGKNRRDCGVKPIVSVAEQCLFAGVPVFVKQDCAALPGRQGRIPDVLWQLKQFPKTDVAILNAETQRTQSAAEETPDFVSSASSASLR